MDLPLEPRAVTAGALYHLLWQQRTSQDDFRVSYAGERLRASWKVAHHWDKWDRMEHEVGKLTFANTRRCKLPTQPLLQEQEAKEQAQEDVEDEQADKVQDKRSSICTYITCSNSPLVFSSCFLSWTVPKLIGHQNVKCHILDMTKLFCQSLDKLVLLLEHFNVTKVTSSKVWDPGGTGF